MNGVIDRLGEGGNALLWLRRVLLAGLTALAVWLAVRLIIGLVAPSSLYEPVLIGTAASAETASGPVDYDFSYNPFNAGEPEPVVVEVDTGDDAPETTLNLQLKGLRAGANGSAFIRTPNGDEDNYYIGDEVMPGVTLRGVFPNHVLIDVNGQTQRLTTEDAKAARTSGTTNQPRQGLQTLRAPDASTLLSQLQFIPIISLQGEREGVKVKARSAGVDLETYGIFEDDIITRFAGQPLTSGFPDMAALRRAVSPGRPITVDLVRDGQPMTITIGSSR